MVTLFRKKVILKSFHKSTLLPWSY